MLNAERQGGWGVGQTPNPPSNPFGQPRPTPPYNPFAQTQANPFQQKQSNGALPIPNPFSAKLPASNPFVVSAPNGQNQSASSPFGQPQDSTPKSNVFGKPSFEKSSASKPLSQQTPAFGSKAETPSVPNVNGTKRVAEYVQPAWPKPTQRASDLGTASKDAPKSQPKGKRRNDDDSQRKNKFSRKSPDTKVASTRDRSPAKDNKQITTPKGDTIETPRTRADPDEFARMILNQLAKDNLKPPRWPENPGSFSQRQAIERLRESHKAYRDKARKSLMRAGLIDDPDKKRRLDEALVFKGICEDMCPEWEKITRIVEHDIKGPEKDTDETGDLVPMPELMVKRLARSAAGQDAPLPMDVRSVRTLRRTLGYLIDLISSDDMLPQRHSFLWDRTRAIRIDFSFQKYAMTRDEIKDQIYCLETITRFHVTSLHLLSQDGFAPPDFSEQQEVEQLGKTLISLMEVYDDCAQYGIECENEQEFRGYFIVFNAFNPSLMEMIEGFDRRFGDSPNVKSAICIVECISNIRKLQGPLYPDTYSQMAVDAISLFFDLVASPSVSYTLACFAEIHFNGVRKAMLKVFKRSFSRPRYGPKDLTPAILKQHLYTDTEEEAVEFFEKHGFQFDDTDGYVILGPGTEYIDARMPHPFSGEIVERKRSGHTFPEVVQATVFDQNVNTELTAAEDGITWEGEEEEESLFVTDSQNVSDSESRNQGERNVREDQDSEAESTEPTPPASPPMLGNHVIAKPTTSVPLEQSPTPGFAQPGYGSEVGSRNPFVSSTTPVSMEQSTALTSVKSLGDSGTKVTSPPPPSLTPVPQERTASIFSQPTSTVSSSMTSASLGGTVSSSPFSNISGASTPWAPRPSVGTDVNKATEQNHTENANKQLPSSTTKRVRFGDDVLLGQSTPTSNTTTPGHFNFDNGESKNTTTPLTTPNTSPFSGLLPKAPDVSNKGVSQPSVVPLGTHTPESASKIFNSSEPTSTAAQPAVANTFPNSSPFTQGQPTSVAETGRPAFNTNQQVSGVFATPTPSVFSTTQPDSSLKAPVTTQSALTSQQLIPTSTLLPKNTTQDDTMSNFARWFVSGDRGLLEPQFQNLAVERIIEKVWDVFQTAEEEKAQKEEEEMARAKAREYREHNLKVKYFYRWHEGFRKRQRIRRIKMEREKARQWNLPENIAKREREAKESQERIVQGVKNSMLKRSRHNVDEVVQLKASTGSRLESGTQNIENALSRLSPGTSDLETKVHHLEDALLATGIFEGVKDERAAARYAAMEPRAGNNQDVLTEQKMRLRAENQRRIKRGLRPLKALPEPRAYKEGSKTAMIRARCGGNGRDTMSMSTGSLRDSTFSSSYRSSLGYNNSRVTKPQSRVTGTHWRLRANGLVRMPNGEYLHESVALPLLRGEKQIPGFGNYGLPVAKTAAPIQSPPSLRGNSSPIQTDVFQSSPSSSSPLAGESQKRKRQADEDSILNGNETLSRTKRARSQERDAHSVTDAGKHLADIASLLNRVESTVGSIKSATPGRKASP